MLVHRLPDIQGLLVPKLQLGNAAFEAPASRETTKQSLQYVGSQAGASKPLT